MIVRPGQGKVVPPIPPHAVDPDLERGGAADRRRRRDKRHRLLLERNRPEWSDRFAAGDRFLERLAVCRERNVGADHDAFTGVLTIQRLIEANDRAGAAEVVRKNLARFAERDTGEFSLGLAQSAGDDHAFALIEIEIECIEFDRIVTTFGRAMSDRIGNRQIDHRQQPRQRVHGRADDGEVRQRSGSTVWLSEIVAQNGEARDAAADAIENTRQFRARMNSDGGFLVARGQDDPRTRRDLLVDRVEMDVGQVTRRGVFASAAKRDGWIAVPGTCTEPVLRGARHAVMREQRRRNIEHEDAGAIRIRRRRGRVGDELGDLKGLEFKRRSEGPEQAPAKRKCRVPGKSQQFERADAGASRRRLEFDAGAPEMTLRRDPREPAQKALIAVGGKARAGIVLMHMNDGAAGPQIESDAGHPAHRPGGIRLQGIRILRRGAPRRDRIPDRPRDQRLDGLEGLRQFARPGDGLHLHSRRKLEPGRRVRGCNQFERQLCLGGDRGSQLVADLPRQHPDRERLLRRAQPRLARRALDIEADRVGEHREGVDQRDRQVAVVTCAKHQQPGTPRVRERANHSGLDLAMARGPIPDRRQARSIGLNDRALVHSPPSTSKLAIPRPGKFGSFSRIAISRRPDASTPSLSPSRLGSSCRRNVVITTSRTPSTLMAAS